MGCTILFGSTCPDGWGDDCSRRHGAGRHQTLGAVTPGLLLLAFGDAWRPGQGGVQALQGLDAGLLLRAHALHAVLGQRVRLLVHLAYRRHLCGTRLRILRLGVEPVRYSLRWHIDLMVKNAPHCGG